jgi:hypothetical protein
MGLLLVTIVFVITFIGCRKDSSADNHSEKNAQLKIERFDGYKIFRTRTGLGYEKGGELKVKAEFQNLEERPSSPLAWAMKHGKYGYINPQGKVIVPFKFSVAGSFREGLAAVQVDGKYGYIDEGGRWKVGHQSYL